MHPARAPVDGLLAVRPVYGVEEDLPGRRLTLVWRGPAPQRMFRWLGLAAAVCILAAAFWFARRELIPVLNREAQQAGGDVIGMAVLGCILILGACVMSFFVVRACASRTRYISRVAWDAGDGVFEAVERGWMLFGSRRTQTPIASITSLDMTVGSETSRGGLPVRVSVSYRRGDEPQGAVIKPGVDQVDRRSEAMDLLFRIARITGHRRYMVLRSDPRELRLTLLRDHESRLDDDDLADDDLDDELEDEDELDGETEDDDEQSDNRDLATDREGETAVGRMRRPAGRSVPQVFEIPAELGAARYEASEPPRGFVEPAIEVPPLDRDFLADGLAPAHLVEWDPPRRVRITRDAVPRSVLIASGVIAGLFGAGLGAWLLHNLVAMLLFNPPGRWDSAAFGGLVGALMGPLLIWAFNRQREVTIDRPMGTITCRHGELTRSYPLDELCEVTLIGQQQTQTESQGKRPATTAMVYRCRIELGIGQVGQWAFDSGEWDRSPDRPYARLLSLSVELARALGVPWRWQDDGQQNTAQWFRRLGWKERGAVAALTVSLFCYPALLMLKERPSKDGVARVKATGTDISFYNGYTIGDHRVLENYWKIEFKPADFDDQKLRAIVPAMSQIDRVGLCLSDTGMGDAGVALLAEANNLLLLDLNSTGVTSDALASLDGFDRLEYLSVANTIVGDAGLERLAPLPNLRFLMLATTRVTDAGLAHVEKFPKLEYVGLHNLPLSAAAIGRLQAARPRLTIAR